MNHLLSRLAKTGNDAITLMNTGFSRLAEAFQRASRFTGFSTRGNTLETVLTYLASHHQLQPCVYEIALLMYAR